MLGKGMYGCVYEVTKKSTQQVEAVKVQSTREVKSRKASEVEAMIWIRIPQHRNIVTLHEIYEEHNNTFFVMEKCDCNILSRLYNGYRMRDVISLFRQMLSAVAHLHSLHIAHRDIKFENFLCVGKGFECVKLCDFGFATTVQPGKKMTRAFGTPPYMSPEMVTGRSYDLKTDVWAIGVCCYFLLSGGHFPYEPTVRTSAGMKEAIAEGSDISADFSTEKNVTFIAKNFTISLLDRNPSRRLTAEEALQHRFLRSSFSYGSGDMSPTSSSQSTVASEQELQDFKREISSSAKWEYAAEGMDKSSPIKHLPQKFSL